MNVFKEEATTGEIIKTIRDNAKRGVYVIDSRSTYKNICTHKLPGGVSVSYVKYVEGEFNYMVLSVCFEDKAFVGVRAQFFKSLLNDLLEEPVNTKLDELENKFGDTCIQCAVPMTRHWRVKEKVKEVKSA